MKKDGKPIAWLLAFSFLCILPLKVNASQEEYVLAIPQEASAEAVPYSYVTPFTVTHTVTDLNGEPFFAGNCAPQIFLLTGADGEAVTAYCADAGAPIQPGAHYRRINLEDSSYFNDTVAGKLRAVLRHSFPMRQVEEVQESANLWLRERELPEIKELQSGEAVLAAQIAIWKLAGGGTYTVNSLYGGIADAGGFWERTRHKEELLQKETEHTASNIECLYTYLYNLSPEKANTVLASDASITRTVYSCVSEDDTTYTALICVCVEVQAREEDRLYLKASCGDQTQEQYITGAGEYTFTFTELTQRSEVKLELYGVQYGSDVYLFDAEGGCEASQTLIGYHEGYMPVYSERVLTPIPAAPFPPEPEEILEDTPNADPAIIVN